MSSARSSRSHLFLAARDSRQEALVQALSRGYSSTLFVSSNIPGEDKMPPGSEAFFSFVCARVRETFPELVLLHEMRDILGPCVILGLDADSLSVKKRCTELEMEQTVSRLIDLDVYAQDGSQIGRGKLGMQQRCCLVCEQSAVDCIRIKRHDYVTIIGRVHELLAPFRD